MVKFKSSQVIWSKGQSEVLTIIILTGVLVVIAVTALYFGSDLLTSSSGTSEFVAAQSSLIAFSELLEQKVAIEGSAASISIPTSLGSLTVADSFGRIVFNVSGVSNPETLSIAEINNSRIVKSIAYYAHGKARGALVNGTEISGDTIATVKEEGPIVITVAFNDQVDRWCVKLTTKPHYFIVETGEVKHSILHLILLNASSNYNELVSVSSSSTLKFYVEKLYRDVLPEGATLQVIVDGEVYGTYGGENEILTVIVSVARLSVLPG